MVDCGLVSEVLRLLARHRPATTIASNRVGCKGGVVTAAVVGAGRAQQDVKLSSQIVIGRWCPLRRRQRVRRHTRPLHHIPAADTGCALALGVREEGREMRGRGFGSALPLPARFSLLPS